MAGPGPLVTLVLTYLLTILYVGPKLMANRKPFHMRSIILTYDAVQIGLNVGLLVYVSVRDGWTRGLVTVQCDDAGCSRIRRATAAWC